MRTRRSNIARLRAGDIGSISAWLPSRRSVDSQRGALVMRLSGQTRSEMSTASYGVYLWIGIPDGFCVTVAAVMGVGRPTEFADAEFGAVVMWAGLLSNGLRRPTGRRWATPDSAGRGS